MNHTDMIRDFCIYCGQLRSMVWIHSHYHCTSCLNNAIPSCEGEEIDAEAIPVLKKKSKFSKIGLSLADTKENFPL